MKKIPEQIFDFYFVNPIPDSSNPAHADGWLTGQSRRQNRANKLVNQYGRLNQVIDRALDNGCFPQAEQRTVLQLYLAIGFAGSFLRTLTHVKQHYFDLNHSNWGIVVVINCYADNSCYERKINLLKLTSLDNGPALKMIRDRA